MKTHLKKINKNSNIIFTCEHASSRIPKTLKNLGVCKKDLKNCKDLYDPGAKDLFDLFTKKYRSSYIYSNLSRLVIDTNRHLDAKNKDSNSYHSALIKKQILVEEKGKEYFVNIPYNQNISFDMEKKMYSKICVPYQNEIKKIIHELHKTNEQVFIISIHTMFPSYNGPFRKEEIDLIGYEDSVQFQKVLKSFKNFKYFKVGINKPWGFEDADDGCFFEIIKIKNVHVMALEIRNDLIKDKKDLKKIFELINEKIMEFTK